MINQRNVKTGRRLALAVCILGVAVATPSWAQTAPAFKITDNHGNSIIIDSSDNTPTCSGTCSTTSKTHSSTTPPSVAWTGTIGPTGAQFSISNLTGSSKPVLGTASLPTFDVGPSTITYSGSSGTLTILWSDTGFTGAGPSQFFGFSSFVSGSGSTTYALYSDSANNGKTLFSLANRLATTGSSPVSGSSNPFVQSTANPSSTPFSLTASETLNFTSSGTSFSGDITYTMAPAPPPPTVKCPTSTATVGVHYSSQIVVTGGVPPYTYAIVYGSLPDGLTLSPTGLISGTPTGSSQTGAFKIKVTDSAGNVAYSNCSGSCTGGSSISYGGGQSQGWGQKGSSCNYTSNGISLSACGWSTSGQSANLYSNNNGGNSFLGLANWSNQNQIDSGHFVQFDFSNHIGAGASGATFVVTSNDWNASFDVYGSNTPGSLGTLLVSNVSVSNWNTWNSQSNGTTQNIPNFGKYRYVCIKAHTGDCQVATVTVNYTCSCAIDVSPSQNNWGGSSWGQGSYSWGQGNSWGGNGWGSGSQGSSPGQCGW